MSERRWTFPKFIGGVANGQEVPPIPNTTERYEAHALAKLPSFHDLMDPEATFTARTTLYRRERLAFSPEGDRFELVGWVPDETPREVASRRLFIELLEAAGCRRNA